MKKGIYNKVIAAAMAAVFFVTSSGVGMLCQTISYADSNVVEIDSPEKFYEMADECRSQTYSSGKVFKLTKDIDMSEYLNVTVPYMDGTFKGNGHSITGVLLEDESSDYALFRFLGENGLIEDLKVEGHVIGGDDQQDIAILVGNNSGYVNKCVVRGQVNGQSIVAGLVGLNAETGRISDCTNEAEIDGKLKTGGICGSNEGYISGCTNKGKVNTNPKIKKKSSDGTGDSVNISIPDAVTGVTADERANETGGIAGYTKGKIYYCVNEAMIGHKDLGSATGGIAGFDSGEIANCENKATVHGRKNVGGIVGCLDPDEVTSVDKDYIRQLRDQLEELDTAMEELSNAGEALGDNFSDNMDVVSDEVTALRDTLRVYTDAYSDDFNVSRGGITAQVNRARDVVDDMDYDFKTQKLVKEKNALASDIDKMEELIVQIRLLTPGLSVDDYLQIAGILDMYEKQILSIQQTIAKLMELINSRVEDKKSSSAKLDGKKDDSEDDGLVEEVPEDTAEEETSEPAVSEPEEGVADNDQLTETIPQDNAGESNSDDSVSGSEDGVTEDGRQDNTADGADEAAYTGRSSAARNSVAEVEDSLDGGNVEDTIAVMTLLSELKKTSEDASDRMDAINKILDAWPKEFKEVRNDLRDISDHMGSAYDQTNAFLDRIHSRTEAMKVDVRNISNDLSDSADLTHTQLDADWDRFNSSMDALRNQITAIRSTVNDGYDELHDRIDEGSVYVDISEGTSLESGKGKIAYCNNSGEIYAYACAGGIAGSIDKEDPSYVSFSILDELKGLTEEEDDEDEEDIEHNDSFTKHILALIYDCKNISDVTIDNDYAGGIVGKSAYGLISDCQDYGDVVSSDGKYIGGIAGYSNLTIVGSYMLGGVSGTSYVGGVAGRGNNIYDSYVCSYMDMDNEYTKGAGAIAGRAKGSVSANFFVDNGYGGVDGVTKTGEALAMSYDKLIKLKNLPKEFKQFTVKFVDNDEVVWSDSFEYGSRLAKEDYPVLSKIPGEYEYWEEKSTDPVCRNITIHSVRRVFIPSIEAFAKGNDTVKADMLLGGFLYPDARLNVSIVDAAEDSKIKEIKNSIKQDIHFVVMKSYKYSLEMKENLEGECQIRVLNSTIPSDKILILDENMRPVTDIVAVKSVGSYLAYIGDIPNSGYIVLIDQVSRATVAIVAIAVIILLVVFAGIIIFLRSRRKNKGQEADDEDNDSTEKEDAKADTKEKADSEKVESTESATNENTSE